MANSRWMTSGSTGGREGGDGADGEERGGPPGEDAGPEERDAEEEAAGQM